MSFPDDFSTRCFGVCCDYVGYRIITQTIIVEQTGVLLEGMNLQYEDLMGDCWDYYSRINWWARGCD